MHDLFNRSYMETIGGLWSLWLLYWIVSAFRVKGTRQSESPRSRITYVLPIACGIVLFANAKIPALEAIVIPHSDDSLRIATALVALGLGFAVWARWHLGQNWSARITAKDQHELIRSGPYAYVRHPIYTGLLTAALGTAVAVGALHAFAGVALVIVGYVRKLTIEEQWMSQTFGEQYAKYKSEVPALIPFVF